MKQPWCTRVHGTGIVCKGLWHSHGVHGSMEQSSCIGFPSNSRGVQGSMEQSSCIGFPSNSRGVQRSMEQSWCSRVQQIVVVYKGPSNSCGVQESMEQWCTRVHGTVVYKSPWNSGVQESINIVYKGPSNSRDVQGSIKQSWCTKVHQ